jgi:Zn-dependent protease
MPLIVLVIILIAWNFASGQYSDFRSWIVTELECLPGIILGLAFHEFGHAVVSDRLGDPTPRREGRVSLNPLRHIDPIGFLCLIFAGFGWGVPVEIDPRYYKHPRRDEFLVSIAGVVMNLLLAILFTLILKLLLVTAPTMFYTETGGVVANVITDVIYINVILMIFNLLPVPPLDGFGILTQIFDLRKYSWYAPLYQNGFAILMVLLLFNVVDRLLTPAAQWVLGLLQMML